MGKPAIFIAVLLVSALVINLIGCGGGDATPIPTGAVTPSPSPTAKPITLKLVCSAPIDDATTRAYYHFADLVEFHTDGRVTIDVYPGSQLFAATEEFEAVVGGTVDIFADATYYFSQYVPDVMVSYIDGLWEGYDHA